MPCSAVPRPAHSRRIWHAVGGADNRGQARKTLFWAAAAYFLIIKPKMLARLVSGLPAAARHPISAKAGVAQRVVVAFGQVR